MPRVSEDLKAAEIGSARENTARDAGHAGAKKQVKREGPTYGSRGLRDALGRWEQELPAPSLNFRESSEFSFRSNFVVQLRNACDSYHDVIPGPQEAGRLPRFAHSSRSSG